MNIERFLNLFNNHTPIKCTDSVQTACVLSWLRDNGYNLDESVIYHLNPLTDRSRESEFKCPVISKYGAYITCRSLKHVRNDFHIDYEEFINATSNTDKIGVSSEDILALLT